MSRLPPFVYLDADGVHTVKAEAVDAVLTPLLHRGVVQERQDGVGAGRPCLSRPMGRRERRKAKAKAQGNEP